MVEHLLRVGLLLRSLQRLLLLGQKGVEGDLCTFVFEITSIYFNL